MDKVAEIERRIARLNELENVASWGCAVGLAALYLWWQYRFNHWIATYTWMIPFAIGFCVSRLFFTMREHRLDRERRTLLALPNEPLEIPEARVERIAPPAPRDVAVGAPLQIAQTPPDHEPAFLKSPGR